MKYTPFYELSPWPERFAAGWENVSAEHKKEFIRLSIEQGHKKEYYAALDLMGVEGPLWEELTDEQRENIRQENNRYQREMHEFGKLISEGKT